MCCIDLDALVLVCMDTSDSRHGAQVTEIVADDPSGISVTWMDRQGKSGKGRFPRCVTTSDCCYDANKGVIVCPSPSDPLHNQSAELVEEYGNGYVYICFSTGRQRGEAPCFDPETGTVVGGHYDGVSPPEGSWSLSEDGTWSRSSGSRQKTPLRVRMWGSRFVLQEKRAYVFLCVPSLRRLSAATTPSTASSFATIRQSTGKHLNLFPS